MQVKRVGFILAKAAGAFDVDQNVGAL